MPTASRARDDRHQQAVPRRQGARRRRLPAVPGRGARPDGRERRRQVHADQGADRRLRHRRGRHHPRRRAGRASPGRCRPSRPASAPSTRRSTSAPTSPSRRTSSSAGSPGGSAGSAWRRMRRRAGELLAAAASSTSTSRPRSATYSLAVQQMVAIARAIDIDAKVLDPRRADLQPRRRRGRAAVPGDAAAQGGGHRDPVRHPLPRPGLRDLRPDDRAAQRPAGRRVPHRRAQPARPGQQDDRQGAGGPRAARGAARRAVAALERGTPVVQARRPRPHAARSPRSPDHPPGRGGRPGRPAGLRPHRAGPAALRRRPRRPRPAPGRRRAGRVPRAADRDGRTASPSARRTAAPKGWSRS